MDFTKEILSASPVLFGISTEDEIVSNVEHTNENATLKEEPALAASVQAGLPLTVPSSSLSETSDGPNVEKSLESEEALSVDSAPGFSSSSSSDSMSELTASFPPIRETSLEYLNSIPDDVKNQFDLISTKLQTADSQLLVLPGERFARIDTPCEARDLGSGNLGIIAPDLTQVIQRSSGCTIRGIEEPFPVISPKLLPESWSYDLKVDIEQVDNKGHIVPTGDQFVIPSKPVPCSSIFVESPFIISPKAKNASLNYRHVYAASTAWNSKILRVNPSKTGIDLQYNLAAGDFDAHVSGGDILKGIVPFPAFRHGTGEERQIYTKEYALYPLKFLGVSKGPDGDRKVHIIGSQLSQEKALLHSELNINSEDMSGHQGSLALGWGHLAVASRQPVDRELTVKERAYSSTLKSMYQAIDTQFSAPATTDEEGNASPPKSSVGVIVQTKSDEDFEGMVADKHEVDVKVYHHEETGKQDDEPCDKCDDNSKHDHRLMTFGKMKKDLVLSSSDASKHVVSFTSKTGSAKDVVVYKFDSYDSFNELNVLPDGVEATPQKKQWAMLFRPNEEDELPEIVMTLPEENLNAPGFGRYLAMVMMVVTPLVLICWGIYRFRQINKRVEKLEDAALQGEDEILKSMETPDTEAEKSSIENNEPEHIQEAVEASKKDSSDGRLRTDSSLVARKYSS